MKKILYILTIAVFAFSCEIEEQVNPNAPALDGILASASTTDLNNLVTGALARMRNSHDVFITASGTVSRELYLFDADPRNTTDLIGSEGRLDDNTFYTTQPWSSRYRAIKNLNILLASLDNATSGVTDADKAGYRGFAKTLMGHQLLMLWSAQHTNGVRLDVDDFENLGPVVTDSDAILGAIIDMLNDGASDLASADFSLILTSGFNGFDTPEQFLTFNRAIAARAALYRGDKTAATNYLASSFLDMAGELSRGPKMIFSTSGGDILNPLYKSPNQNGDQIIVNDHWIADAEVGDARVTNKTGVRASAQAKSGLNGTNETRLFSSSTEPLDIIRNEELILISAELSIGVDNTAAEAAINVIRNAAGLADYAGATDDASLLDEVLHQRRYSLWGEGHRMVDLRRNGRLNETYVTIDPVIIDEVTVDQEIFQAFPLPSSEGGN